jgi:hypothetical protein
LQRALHVQCRSSSSSLYIQFPVDKLVEGPGERARVGLIKLDRMHQVY